VIKTQSIVLPVTANPAVKSVFITGSIPTREKRIIVDGAQTVTVTGEGVIPQSKAKGAAVFRNLTQGAVTIPAGTVIQSAEGVRFVTTQGGSVEAGVGETIELPIEAVEGGLVGNLEPETINAIEGRLGLSLSVTNPDPTAGGREVASVQASDADRKRVRDLLMRKLERDARRILYDEMGSGDALFEDTFAVSQILSEIYDPPPGAAGVKLTLTMRVEYSARCASASDLTELAALAMNASLPSGFSAASSAMTVEPATKPATLLDGSTRWTVRAERQIVQQIDPARVTQMILGMTSASAQTKLDENLPLASSPTITFSPSWWQWVPIVPFRVTVVTE
jgi:hypothetical protein